MKPDDYNASELAAGRITASHVTALTRFFQERTGLEPDSKLGPVTRYRLCPGCEVERVFYEVIRRNDAAIGADAAIEAARRDARTWANTGGLAPAHVAELRKGLVRGMWADERPHANWCAAAVASWLEAGGIPIPRKGAPRRGAQALTRWVAGHGVWVIAPGELAWKSEPEHRAWVKRRIQPGDVICWKRPPLGWRGHVALILAVHADGGLEIADGNANGDQLVIRALGPDEWPTRLSGLYGVARPNYGGAR